MLFRQLSQQVLQRRLSLTMGHAGFPPSPVGKETGPVEPAFPALSLISKFPAALAPQLTLGVAGLLELCAILRRWHITKQRNVHQLFFLVSYALKFLTAE